MATKMTLDSAVKHISRGMENTIEIKLRELMMTQAEAMVIKIAKEMASSLRSNVTAWEEMTDREIVISLSIDGVKHDES